MKPKLPESSFINLPHEVKGTPKEARASFYELAKNKIKYLSDKEVIEWVSKTIGPKEYPSKTAVSVIHTSESKNLRKWVNNLEIIINKDAFKIKGKDYSDLIPFVVDHEIFEGWLYAKKGVGSKKAHYEKHLLARRRQYLLAEQQGLGDKMLEWHNKLNPAIKEECEYALRVARKQLQGKKK